MDLMSLSFIKDASNVVIVGPNGVGKSMCAANRRYMQLEGLQTLSNTVPTRLSAVAR